MLSLSSKAVAWKTNIPPKQPCMDFGDLFGYSFAAKNQE